MCRQPLRRGATAALLAAAVLGGSLSAAADTGFAFLRLGAGARAAALSEATTALAGPEGASANPAALAPERAVSLSHTEWIGDVRHEHAASTWARPGGDRLALDLRLAHAGGLERRTGPSLEPAGEFGVYEWTAGLAWARPVGPRLRLGVGLKYARQSIHSEAASGGAVDLGLLAGEGPWWVGAALRNLGRMDELAREATDLPRQLRLGGAVLHGPVLLSADGHWTQDNDPGLHLGVEFRSHRSLVLRAGYQTADTRDVSLGLGARAGAWGLDYAFVPFGDGLGEAHRVSLVWLGGRGHP